MEVDARFVVLEVGPIHGEEDVISFQSNRDLEQAGMQAAQERRGWNNNNVFSVLDTSIRTSPRSRVTINRYQSTGIISLSKATRIITLCPSSSVWI